MLWINYLQAGATSSRREADVEAAAVVSASYCASTTVTLYHQTSPENARKILSTGVMKPGITGYGGAGIYFAPEIGATCCKATKKGVILECQVELGRIKEIRQQGDWSGRIWRKLYGYDSIKITSLDDGIEYVIFDPLRVKGVQLWRPPVQAAEMAAAVLAQHCAWFMECVVLSVLQAVQECCRVAVQQQGQQSQRQQQYVGGEHLSFSSQKSGLQQQC